MDKVCLIIKPGALEYKNDIIKQFTKFDYTVATEQLMRLDQAQCDAIWHDVAVMAEERKEELGADYYQRYCNYIMSDDIIAIVLEKSTVDYDFITRIKYGVRAKYNGSGFKDILHTSDSNVHAIAEITAVFTE